MSAGLRWVAGGCAGLAVLSAGFAWWGLNTVAGRHEYDEMAGMIPLAAGLFSPVFAMGALAAVWVGARARGRTRR